MQIYKICSYISGLCPSPVRRLKLLKPLGNMLQIKRLTDSSKLPSRGSEFSAGYDIYASEPAVVKFKNRALVPTGIAISVPPGTYGRIAPRSGLAVKHGIDVGAGVIDLAVFYASWNILQNCPNHASRLSMGLTRVPV